MRRFLWLATLLTSVSGCSVILDFDDPPLAGYEVRGGGQFTCATVAQNGPLFCWGANHQGQGGIGKTGDGFWNIPPSQVVGMEAVAGFDLGYEHGCAFDGEGSLYCWGGNDRNQLGIAPINQLNEPGRVAGIPNVSQVSVGSRYSCAVADGDRLYCFGDNHYYQLTAAVSEEQTPTPTQILVPEGVLQVAAGTRHVCALARNNNVWCWGFGYDGQTGVAGATGVACGEGGEWCLDQPTQVASLDRIGELQSGGEHTCALSDGTLWCWGKNDYGQVGVGNLDAQYVPAEVPTPGGIDWKTVAVGGEHTCGIDVAGQVHCWGSNERDQAGTAATDVHYYDAPVTVEALDGEAARLGLGEDHSCVVMDDGKLYCWGWNQHQQIGDLGDSYPLPNPIDRW